MNNDFTVYLPQYLSEKSTKDIIGKLNQFPNNINDRFYTTALEHEETIFQGDGLEKLPHVDWSNNKLREVPSIVLSNTCDLDIANKRVFTSSISYAPIANLDKYINTLRLQKIGESTISQHLSDIKAQKITQIFYLPKINKLGYEGIVFLDRLMSMPSIQYDLNRLNNERLFTLSNYGFYVLLFKISVHFMRMQEKVDRNEGVIL